MCKRSLSILFGLIAVVTFVHPAFASVVVNEIAWAGTPTSSNDEWIELFNDGSSAEDLTGWKLEAKGGTPSIALKGKIDGGGYYLIERTNDDVVPTTPADLVDSFGSLSNEGETLYLKNSAGLAVDTVIGGKQWTKVGGNNTSKHTASRFGTGWMSGTPTPRAANIKSEEVTLPAGASVSEAQARSSGALCDTETFVDFLVTCRASDAVMGQSGVGAHWNFGDGSTGDGRIVTHQYHFPGTYAAVLEVSGGDTHTNDQTTITVTDTPPVVNRIISGEQGFIELKSRSVHKIDIAGWRLKETVTGREFMFASSTILLAKKTLTLPNSTTGLFRGGEGVTLMFPNGVRASMWSPAERSMQSGLVKGASVAAVPEATSTADTLRSGDGALHKGEASSSAATVLWAREQTKSSSGFLGGMSANMTWVFICIGLLLAVLATFLIAKSRVDESTPADEYAIIEDIIESEEDYIKKS